MFEGVFLEVFGFVDGGIGEAGEEGAGLGGVELFSEELVDGEEVDGEGVDAAWGVGFDAVGVGAEFSEALDVVPDFGEVGVEDVGAVVVDHDVGGMVAGGVAVAGEVGAFVKDEDVFAGFFGEFAGGDCAGKASADDEEFRGLGHSGKECGGRLRSSRELAYLFEAGLFLGPVFRYNNRESFVLY